MEQQILVDISPIIKDGVNISHIKNIILIDKTIETPEIFFLENNNETLPIYYNYYTDSEKLFEYLEQEFINIDRLAFIFDNSMMNNKNFLNNELFFTDNDIIQFENNKECLENYSSNVIFLIKICKKFNIKNVDFLACNSLEHNNWKIYYELLKHFSTTVIGASNDLTGNVKYGGDWVMENTNEDIQHIYFNENITNYSSTLFSSSISYSVLLFSGRTAILFIIETTNNFSNLVLSNFTNLYFEYFATNLQKIYNVYYREENVGTFLLASNVNNLNINLSPNKKYEIILIFTSVDNFNNGYYIYDTESIPITSVLSSTNELKMYPSKSNYLGISTFNPNNLTTYNTLKNGAVRNQSLTLNYTFQLPPTISNFSIPTKIYGDAPFEIPKPTSNSSGLFSYTSSNLSVATIYGDIINSVGPGSSTITATQQATANYTSGTITTTFQVNQSTPTNPIIINNNNELLYFMNTSSSYANITNNLEINYDLIASSYKVLTGNNISITKSNN